MSSLRDIKITILSSPTWPSSDEQCGGRNDLDYCSSVVQVSGELPVGHVAAGVLICGFNCNLNTPKGTPVLTGFGPVPQRTRLKHIENVYVVLLTYTTLLVKVVESVISLY